MASSLDDLIKRVRLRPSDPVLRGHLGLALMRAGRLKEATDHLSKAHRKLPKEPTLSNALAQAHSALGDHDAALKFAGKAVKAAPGAVELLANQANFLGKAGRSEESIQAYRRIIEVQPDFIGAHLGLGNVANDVGDIDVAVEAFEQALTLQPTNTRAFYSLALIVKGGQNVISNELKARFEGHLESPSVSDNDSALIHAALGQIADRSGDYAVAFEHFRRFNELSLAKKRPSGAITEDQKLKSFLEAVRSIAGELKNDQVQSEDTNGITPIFIVGMPRSGTTLVEQILLQDKGVHSVGESLALHRLSSQVPDYPVGLPGINEALRKKLRRAYLSELSQMGRGTRFVLEKLPENFIHIGLIGMILPEAKVIQVKRDPRDVCLSCYFHNFSAGHTFCHDLAELGRYFRTYDALMDLWRRTGPLAVFELSYEQLTEEPEEVLGSLCQFLGITYAPSLLDFHKSRRSVATASALQVRQPLNSKAVGRWEHYEAYLGPLLAELEK